MKRVIPFAICSLILSACAPKITDCIINWPKQLAHCEAPNAHNNHDIPFDQMEKYTCFSPDDFADLLRGTALSTLTTCTIVNVKEDDVHCSTPTGEFETTLEGINKFSCLSPDDIDLYERWYEGQNHS
jgi:hypothetical protein